MKIVLTGANGFIGNAFLTAMQDRIGTKEVVLLSSTERGAEQLREKWPSATVARLYRADGAVQVDAMNGGDVLIHLGWSTVPSTAAADPLGDLRDNVESGLRLMAAAGEAAIKRFIFPSSGGTVYGEPQRLPLDERHATLPVTAYGASKLCFEQYLRPCSAHYGFEHVILRPSNVYGNSAGPSKPQGVIEHWLSCVAREKPIEVWNGLGTVRDYIHIDDVVSVLFASLDGPVAGRTINVGTGIGTSLAELIELIGEITGKSPELIRRGDQDGVAGVANVLDTGLCATLLGPRRKVLLRDGITRLWAAHR